MRCKDIEPARGYLENHRPMSDTSEFCEGRTRFHRMGQGQANTKRRSVRAASDENNLHTFDALQKSARKRNKTPPPTKC